MSETPKGRKQIQLHVAREAGAVRQIEIQKVPRPPSRSKLEKLLTLNREQSAQLINLIRSLGSIPPEGDNRLRFNDQLLHDILSDPETLGQAYDQDPDRFKELIRTDASANDVIALQRRRDVVQTMRTWINNTQAFKEASVAAGGPERAWQQLLEKNPWVLGVGLGGQLLTSWDEKRLEQVTTGANAISPGKRVDALMRTNGIISSMVFAEIKHHRTDLLANTPYRSSCWGPSAELTGAIVQAQQTVRMATQSLGDSVEGRAGDGSRTGEVTFITQPKSYLVIGSLEELNGDSGNAVDSKVHSFEAFRRNITHPEIITFDELLAKAEWHVDLAEKFQSNTNEN